MCANVVIVVVLLQVKSRTNAHGKVASGGSHVRTN